MRSRLRLLIIAAALAPAMLLFSAQSPETASTAPDGETSDLSPYLILRAIIGTAIAFTNLLLIVNGVLAISHNQCFVSRELALALGVIGLAAGAGYFTACISVRNEIPYKGGVISRLIKIMWKASHVEALLHMLVGIHVGAASVFLFYLQKAISS